MIGGKENFAACLCLRSFSPLQDKGRNNIIIYRLPELLNFIMLTFRLSKVKLGSLKVLLCKPASISSCRQRAKFRFQCLFFAGKSYAPVF